MFTSALYNWKIFQGYGSSSLLIWHLWASVFQTNILYVRNSLKLIFLFQVHGCGSSSTSGGKSPSHGYDSEGEESNSSSERSISVSAMSPHHNTQTDPLMPDHRVIILNYFLSFKKIFFLLYLFFFVFSISLRTIKPHIITTHPCRSGICVKVQGWVVCLHLLARITHLSVIWVILVISCITGLQLLTEFSPPLLLIILISFKNMAIFHGIDMILIFRFLFIDFTFEKGNKIEGVVISAV